jgi:hypothetical protein
MGELVRVCGVKNRCKGQGTHDGERRMEAVSPGGGGAAGLQCGEGGKIVNLFRSGGGGCCGSPHEAESNRGRRQKREN